MPLSLPLSIYLILPDWQGRQLDQVLANTLRNDARYLQQIMAQYIQGKRDDLAYRNRAAAKRITPMQRLAGCSPTCFGNPIASGVANEDLLRFLTIAHTMLGHISALGAHRQAIGSAPARGTITLAGNLVVTKLEHLADALAANTPASQTDNGSGQGVTLHADSLEDEAARLVLGQLALILAHRDRLATVVHDIRTG